MDNMRWILLLVGLLLVAGIYVYGRLQSRDSAPRKRRAVSARLRRNTTADLEGDRFDSFVDDELGSISSLINEDGGIQEGRTVFEVDRQPAAITSANAVFSIFVTAPASVPFRGPVLLGALRAAKLEHGDMQIFHRSEIVRGAETVLFSAANIREPGTFDLTRIEDFATEGVALFMQVHDEIDAGGCFDAMVESARILADSLDGNVCDVARNVLTQQTIRHMREEVINCQLHQRVAQTAS